MTATYPLQRRRRDFDACFANGEAFEASEELAAAMGCFPVFEDVIRIRTNRRLINGGFPMLKGAYLGRKFHRTIFVFMFGGSVNKCVNRHQAAFSSVTWLTGTPLTYWAPW